MNRTPPPPTQSTDHTKTSSPSLIDINETPPPPTKNTNHTKTTTPSQCNICHTNITFTRNSKFLLCSSCKHYTHPHCINITNQIFSTIDRTSWICQTCLRTNKSQHQPPKQANQTIDIICEKENPSNKDIINLIREMMQS